MSVDRPGTGEAGRVFISYVREDTERVGQLKRLLEAVGIRVWLDKDDLWPGEDWRVKIRQAIKQDAMVFIACFSRHSLTRVRSYQYEELTQALDQMRQRRPGDPWLIPVRFDDCELPDLDIGAGRTLRDLHGADLYGDRQDENATRLVTAVLRILGRDAGAASLAVAGRRHVVGSLARSLADGSATRAHVLGFFGQPPLEAARFWRGITDRERDNVLALLLEDLDENGADALCAHWETIAADVARYLGRLLHNGEPDAATWCLSVLSTTLDEDAEDLLLSRLLVPRTALSDGNWHVSAVVNMLRQRLVPRPGTFRRSRAAIRSGGGEPWRTALVRSLLLEETGTPLRIPRAADWVEWLCSAESGEPESGMQPEWITALTSIWSGQVSGPSGESIQALIRSGYEWTIVILRLARQAECLPSIIEVSFPALVDIVMRGELYAELDTGLLRYQMSPESIAFADTIDVIHGRQRREFPAYEDSELIDRYVRALSSALLLETLTPMRIRLQREFLVGVFDGDGRHPAAGHLLRYWSWNPAMAPGVAGYLKTVPMSKLLGRAELDAEFWQAIAAYDRWFGRLVEASRLGEAVTEAVRDPETALRRAVSRAGQDWTISATTLAAAMYRARRAGLSVEDIVAVLSARNGSQLPPDKLDGVLREFQSLLFRAPGADGEVNAATTGEEAEQIFFEFYRKILAGALGDGYGRDFERYLKERLSGESQSRRQAFERLI